MITADIEVTLLGHYGDDLTVVNAARVSFDKQSDWELRYGVSHTEPRWEWSEEFLCYRRISDRDLSLINYLATHGHHSPFNHAFASFRVKAPIFVARQLVKHKFLPWNEVSRRYVDSEPEFYMPSELRARATDVKQGSSSEIVTQLAHEEGREDLWGPFDNDWKPDIYIHHEVDSSLATYKWLLQSGVCPEQARMFLPLNTMTEWIWSGTLGAWMDMLKSRLDPHAQFETRVVAEKICALLLPHFPYSLEANLGHH